MTWKKHWDMYEAQRSIGPDGIPQFIYKACSEFLIAPLTYVYEYLILLLQLLECLKTGRSHLLLPYRECWWYIINFRPITKLLTPDKIIRYFSWNCIYPRIRNRIISEQHGFMRGRTVESNLLQFTHFISETLDKFSNVQVDAIYTDFQKAFDKVNHQIQFQKLLQIGLSERIVTTLLRSYLFNSKQ